MQKALVENAIELMDREKITAYQAAKRAGIKGPTLYTALKRRRAKAAGVCPCCQRPLSA